MFLSNDLVKGLLDYKIWFYLSLSEVRTRYIGSFLGPFWITISQTVLVISIGYIYGGLFGIPPEKYMPFLTCGLICWNLVQGILNEGTRCFGSHKSFLNEIKINPLVFCYKVVFSNFIILAHNSVSIAFIFLLTGYKFSILMPLSLIGFAFIFVNGVLSIIIIGILCERFRDIPSLISNILQISFFITPIIWDPIQFKTRAVLFLKLNPFYHFIEATRAPLLGIIPDMDTYFFLIAITLANTFAASIIYKNFSKKIIYWMQ
jgi:ABC-type polysaccharide/polyol phosphate export permease